jgi:hypothetical protein
MVFSFGILLQGLENRITVLSLYYESNLSPRQFFQRFFKRPNSALIGLPAFTILLGL